MDYNGMLFKYANGEKQICVPKELQECVQHNSHHSKMSGHPSGRRIYRYLIQSFYWPGMEVNCYDVPRQYKTCAKIIVLLRKHQKEMHLF